MYRCIILFINITLLFCCGADDCITPSVEGSVFLFAQQEALSLILLLILETETARVCMFRDGLGVYGRVDMSFSSSGKSRKKGVNDKGL